MYYHNLRNNIENFMYIYLPIAEQPIHSLAILGIGAFLGLIMGLVGVGGGFLLTPLMMFLGIPPPVAVASVANQLVALRFQVFCLIGKEVMLILKWDSFTAWRYCRFFIRCHLIQFFR